MKKKIFLVLSIFIMVIAVIYGILKLSQRYQSEDIVKLNKSLENKKEIITFENNETPQFPISSSVYEISGVYFECSEVYGIYVYSFKFVNNNNKDYYYCKIKSQNGILDKTKLYNNESSGYYIALDKIINFMDMKNESEYFKDYNIVDIIYIEYYDMNDNLNLIEQKNICLSFDNRLYDF